MEKLKELKKRIAGIEFFKSPFFIKHSRLIIPGIVLVVALLILSLVTIPSFLSCLKHLRLLMN